MRYFEDFAVGMAQVYDATYLLTEEEMREMSGRWDPQPFLTDPIVAGQSIFGGLIACSAHLFAVATFLANTPTEEGTVAAVSALGFDKLRMHTPGRPGDQLSLRTVVIEARTSGSRPELGVLRTKFEMTNQADESRDGRWRPAGGCAGRQGNRVKADIGIVKRGRENRVVGEAPNEVSRGRRGDELEPR